MGPKGRRKRNKRTLGGSLLGGGGFFSSENKGAEGCERRFRESQPSLSLENVQKTGAPSDREGTGRNI